MRTGISHAVLAFNLQLLEEVSLRLENMLASTGSDFEKDIEDAAASLEEPERQELYEFYSDDYWFLVEQCPRVMRQSIFLLAFATLEHTLMIVCRIHRHERSLTLKPSDLRGSGIDQAQKYIKQVLGFPFPDGGPSWERIRILQTYRNVIAHRNGELDLDSREDQTLLCRLAEFDGFRVGKRGEVELSRDFSLSTIRLFLAFCEELSITLEEVPRV